jgi:hypothetical protein
MVTMRRLKSVTFFDGDEGDWGFSLDKLSAADRRWAEQWIQDAGAGAFFRIARVVAASKGKGRPRIESEHMLFEAAGLLSDNPKLKPGEAAKKVARRVVAENDWRGREPVSEEGLTTWIDDQLTDRQPQIKHAQAKRRAAEKKLSRPIFVPSRKRPA